MGGGGGHTGHPHTLQAGLAGRPRVAKRRERERETALPGELPNLHKAKHIHPCGRLQLCPSRSLTPAAAAPWREKVASGGGSNSPRKGRSRRRQRLLPPSGWERGVQHLAGAAFICAEPSPSARPPRSPPSLNPPPRGNSSERGGRWGGAAPQAPGRRAGG